MYLYMYVCIHIHVRIYICRLYRWRAAMLQNAFSNWFLLVRRSKHPIRILRRNAGDELFTNYSSRNCMSMHVTSCTCIYICANTHTQSELRATTLSTNSFRHELNGSVHICALMHTQHPYSVPQLR